MRGQIVVVAQSGARLSKHLYSPSLEGDTPLAWQDDAVCAQSSPDEFFPEKGGSTRDAKRLCNGVGKTPECPVKAQCLAYALATDERIGIWGGLSALERAHIRKAAAA